MLRAIALADRRQWLAAAQSTLAPLCEMTVACRQPYLVPLRSNAAVDATLWPQCLLRRTIRRRYKASAKHQGQVLLQETPGRRSPDRRESSSRHRVAPLRDRRVAIFQWP